MHLHYKKYDLRIYNKLLQMHNSGIYVFMYTYVIGTYMV